MKVLLIADVYKHGVAGEVVDVADGFARNWLIPKKLAVKATAAALKAQDELRQQAEARRAQLDQRLNDLARMIDGVELVFGRRASPTGKLFGSVTTTEIAEALNTKTGIDINRRRISQIPLRELGTHMVPVRLGTEISPHLKVTVVREGDVENYLAAQAAAAEADAHSGEAEAETLGEAVGELASAVAAGVGEVVGSAAEAVGNAVSSVVDAVRHAVGADRQDDPQDEQTNA